MVKKLLVLLFVCCYFQIYAENIKTDVLVIGDSPSAVTAAIQSARSKVKTMLIMPDGWLQMGMPSGIKYNVTANHDLPTGIWGEFCERVKAAYKTIGYDAPANITLRFEGSAGAEVLKGIADSLKDLTVKLNTPFTAIKKDGTGWDVSISQNGQTDIIKTKVVIDATEKGEAVLKAGATIPAVVDGIGNNQGDIYRTSIAVSNILPGNFIPLWAIVVKDADNLLVTEKILPSNKGEQYLPLQMALGQGAGTTAAYLAFFKTTTKNLKPRLIQQELLDFKGYLLPFADVKRTDRYIRAVQQIGATGMLKGKPTPEGLLFMPEASITTAEVKPVLTDIYSRAFLWFNREKPGEQFTIGNVLSLISEITLSEPETLRITMRNDWNSKLHFNLPFDLNRPINRLEFSVLVNQYLNPFARTIDLQGNVVN